MLNLAHYYILQQVTTPYTEETLQERNRIVRLLTTGEAVRYATLDDGRELPIPEWWVDDENSAASSLRAIDEMGGHV